MNPESLVVPLISLSAAASILLAIFLLVLSNGSSYRWLALLFVAAGVGRLGDGAAFFLDSSPALCKEIGVVGQALLPALLMSFSASLHETTLRGRKNWSRFLLKILLYVLGILWIITGFFGFLYDIDKLGPGDMLRFTFTPVGVVYQFTLLLGLTFGIVQIEKMLGSLQDPDRYRFQWVLLGTAALAAAQLVQATHALGFGGVTIHSTVLTSIGTLFAVMLVIAGLARTRLRNIRGKIHVSSSIANGSATLLLVGVYLTVVGLAAEWIRDSSGLYGLGLGYATVFAGILVLTMLAMSRTVRLGLKDLVSRHLYRSVHDYRAKWREVTEAFQLTASVDTILTKLIEVLSQTFQAGRISIWMTFDSDGRFRQARSMNTIRESVSLPPDHPLLMELSVAAAPLDTLGFADDGVSSEFFRATQAALLVPLKAGDKLIAFVALSPPAYGNSYTTDDKDLLNGIAHHAAVLLSHAALSEEQASTLKLNLLHQFSAFCLHDIKNLSARLSLVVQNAKAHGHDPAFQKSALETVERTVTRMTELIAKLSANPVKEKGPGWVSLKAIIEDTLISIDHGSRIFRVEIGAEDGVPVYVEKEQLQQVLLNLVLNAKEACRDGSDIVIRAWAEGEYAHVEVSDRGSGMEESQLRALFQPFRSTKLNGFGIGLYQCRQVIERLGGRFTIKSHVGEGTVASIELPIIRRETTVSVSNH